MIVVAGWLEVAPEGRDGYLEGCRAVVEAARAAPGCVDFCISADLVDPGRINVFEQWDSVDSVELFRGSGPGDDQQAAVISAHVEQHAVAATQSLT